MLKHFIVAFIFCLTSSIANAQEQRNKSVVCYPTMEILPLLKQLGEEIVWMGATLTNESYFIVMMNDKTKEFTIIQFDEKTACLIGAGIDSKFIFKKI